MFGLFKKKKVAEEPEIDAEEKKPRKKPAKDQGPAWVSLVIMLVSALAGIFFWLYGQLSKGGFVGVNFLPEVTSESSDSQSPKTNQDGVIIFEK